MLQKEKEFRDLYIKGESAFHNKSNVNNQNDSPHICPHEHEKIILPKDQINIPDRQNCWYLDNYHLNDEKNLELYSHLKEIDNIGKEINSVEYDKKESDFKICKSEKADELAKKFFPITLGKSKELKSEILSINHNCPWSLTFSPPASGLPDKPQPWRVETIHNSGDLHKEWYSNQEHLNQNMKFLDHYNNELKANPLLSTIRTPYQTEISKLRLERLRLEEEILMEIKRQEELHRIRGPTPKWYELRDSRFHYEAHKNNKLLASCENWQELYQYRNQLSKQSQQFKDKYQRYDPTKYANGSVSLKSL